MRFGLGHIQRTNAISDTYPYVNAEARNYVALLVSPISDTLKGEVDALYTDLKDSGVFDKLDCLYIAAPPDDEKESSFINLISPGTDTLQEVGSITWDSSRADWWVTPSLSGSNYLNSGHVLGSGKASLNDHCIFISIHHQLVNSGQSLGTSFDIGSYSAGNSTRFAIVASRSTFDMRASHGSSGLILFSTLTNAVPNHFVLSQRTSSTSCSLYRNGALHQTVTTAAPTDLCPNPMHLLGNSSDSGHVAYSGTFQKYAGWGKALSATEIADLYQIMEDWRTARGKPNYRYMSQTDTVANAMTTAPSDTRKRHMDRLVWDLRTLSMSVSDAWTEIGGLWITKAHDEQAARINWKNPSVGALTGGGTYTNNAGWAYANTNLTISSYTHSSYGISSPSQFFFGCYREGFANLTTQQMLAFQGGTGNPAFYVRDASNNFNARVFRLTAVTTVSVTGYASSPALYFTSRNNSTTTEASGACTASSHSSANATESSGSLSNDAHQFNQGNRVSFIGGANLAASLTGTGTNAVARKQALFTAFKRYCDAVAA